VINRFDPRSLGVAEEHITKALTRPPTWKIPNDFAAVRQMQNTATPLALAIHHFTAHPAVGQSRFRTTRTRSRNQEEVFSFFKK